MSSAKLKKCKGPCGRELEESSENFQFRKDSNTFRTECKLCRKAYQNNYNEENKDVIKVQRKKFRQDNSKRLSKIGQIYYKENKETIVVKKKANYQKNREAILEDKKVYYQENKKEINFKNNKRNKERTKADPVYATRRGVSALVNHYLKKNGSSKNGKSCLKYFQWTIRELHEWIEAKFKEPGNEWMNWNNQGKYIKRHWNPNDSSTWKWQLDHIIPHSTFKYTSMDSEEFRACWALSNLRPLRADLNQLDGVTRKRHKK